MGIEKTKRNAEILDYWLLGKTQTVIAAEMHVSRSIVGAVLSRAREKSKTELLDRDEINRRLCKAWDNRKRKRGGRKAADQEKRQLVRGGRQALELVGRYDCRYPNGTPGQPDFHFCCAPQQDHSPYCPVHTAACYIVKAA